jgi:D-arabinose 1-dehydrogenase-like Zn-dependent alcohol dehydrogenase
MKAVKWVGEGVTRFEVGERVAVELEASQLEAKALSRGRGAQGLVGC